MGHPSYMRILLFTSVNIQDAPPENKGLDRAKITGSHGHQAQRLYIFSLMSTAIQLSDRLHKRHSSCSPSSLSPSPLSVNGTISLFSRLEASLSTNLTGQYLVPSFHSVQIYERRAHLSPSMAVI